MNEITKIHLGRQAFTIAVDAHKALQDYLHAIKKRVGEKGKDVVKEVELRMAELLVERGVTGDKVILLEDVDYLKEQLGSPKDFSEEEATDEDDKDKEPSKASEEPGSKRLFRDTDRGMIAGVAAGLAAYFKTDPVIVRIAFIVLTLFWGWGIVLYLVLWLIVPEAKSSSNRLQMQGKPVTVKSLKEVVDRADVPGATQRVGRTFGRFIEAIGKVLLTIIGIGFILAGASIFLGAATLGSYVLINGGQVNGDVIFPVGANEVWLLLFGLLTAVVLSLLTMFIGIGMVRRKWPVPGWVGASLIGLFLVGGSVGTALGFKVAPNIADRVDALRRTETVQMTQFKEVVLRGDDTQFVYVPSDTYKLAVSYVADKDMSDRMKTIHSNDTLTIDTTAFATNNDCNFICLYNDRDVKITIYAPSLDTVSIEGNDSSFESEEILRQKDMAIKARKFSFVHIGRINPEKIVVREGSVEREVFLHGIRPGAFKDDGIDMGEDVIAITRADKLELFTNHPCEDTEPLLYIDTPPSIDLKINDKPGLQTDDSLETRKDLEEYNIYNCVMFSR